jgi:mRNA interferase HigB
MRVVSHKAIKEFATKHSTSIVALKDWYTKTKLSEWNSFLDIKETFNSVDYIANDRYVFNIKGNDYRLVAIVIFASKKVYIRFIGTHAQYDKIDCSNI